MKYSLKGEHLIMGGIGFVSYCFYFARARNMSYNERDKNPQNFYKGEIIMKLFKKKEDTVEKLVDARLKRMLEVGFFEGNKEEMILLLKQDTEYRKIKNEKIRSVLTIVGIGVTSVITIWGTKETFRFEKDSNFTSDASRSWSRKVMDLYKK